MTSYFQQKFFSYAWARVPGRARVGARACARGREIEKSFGKKRLVNNGILCKKILRNKSLTAIFCCNHAGFATRRRHENNQTFNSDLPKATH